MTLVDPSSYHPTSQAVCASMLVESVVSVSYLRCSCFCQDSLVPFILDSRLPDDTLFWIIEEEFRFWPPGEDPDHADDYDREYSSLLDARARAAHEAAG